MKLQDLGHLDGPVLIFGGPYSNLQATRAVLDQAIARSIAPSHVICTGDVVAYCAQPVETLSEIRRFGCTVVAGNCKNNWPSIWTIAAAGSMQAAPAICCLRGGMPTPAPASGRMTGRGWPRCRTWSPLRIRGSLWR